MRISAARGKSGIFRPSWQRSRVVLSRWGDERSHRQHFKNRLTREVSVKTSMFAALLLASALSIGTASAQPAPFNEAGVTMGHWHLASKDVRSEERRVG